jgi:hypothetical protein
MMLSHRLLNALWYRQVFLRDPHEELDELLSRPLGSSGIYLIGCAKEIVYVGQTLRLKERPIESLGRYYHRVPDTSLPWSIAIAQNFSADLNERESTAIRSYAPKFNTSIPSVSKSQGRMPEVIGVAAVFQDQDRPCGTFDPENLKRQIENARTNPNPPWKRKRTRKKTATPQPRRKKGVTICEALLEEDLDSFKRSFAVPRCGPLPFKINLCEGGDVVTRDGEIVGVWKLDENAQVSFLPNDASEPLFTDMPLGRLCEQIREWYEANCGNHSILDSEAGRGYAAGE